MINQETYLETAASTMEAAETDAELGAQMTEFLCQVLNTVALDGTVKVTDLAGQIACSENNYLMSSDGTEFSGLATLATGEVTNFRIFETPNGKWCAELPCSVVA